MPILTKRNLVSISHSHTTCHESISSFSNKILRIRGKVIDFVLSLKYDTSPIHPRDFVTGGFVIVAESLHS